MKRKQILAALLTGCMLLAGCGTAADSAVTETPAEGASKEEVAADTSVDTASTESSEETAQAESESYVVDGGSPWINSNIKENVVNSDKASAKDDLNLAVNYDWAITAEIPDGYSSYDSFTEVSQIIDDKALETLKDETITGHDAELARAYYNAFLDWDDRNAKGLSPLEPFVKDIESLSSIEDVTEFILDNDRSNFTPTLVGIGNVGDLTDSSRYVTNVDHSSLLLGDSAEYKEFSTVGKLKYDAYRSLFSNMMTRLGYTNDEADKYYDACFSFESALSEKVYTSLESSDPAIYDKILNYYEPEEMAALAPNFPMDEFIKENGYDNAKVFLVTEPDALAKISDLYTSDNLENIKGYFMVQTVLGCTTDLDREAFDARLEAQRSIYGASGTLSDEKYAYAYVNAALPEAMEKAYMAKYDVTETKKEVTQLCKDVADVYREMLENEDWLSDETREYAMEKLDSLEINVVEPKEYVDYSGLDLNGLTYFEIQKALADFSWELDKERTNGTVNKNLWEGMSTLETNAYYDPTANSINILLGILDGVFYGDDKSKEEIYAGIGAVIGHEISHAFDTNGAQFDKDGNYSNWWTDEDYSAFQERAQKLINYYDGITVFGDEKVTGSLVQTEAIADMAGLKAMLTLASKEESFDYKKFFESYANVWKNISTYEAIYSQLTQDAHPLDYLRVNVTSQQFDEFYEAFDVKEGDGMYLAPEDRILIW
ncbi:putative endopeptidase [Butyrivibrio proteoclasticus]|uniref:Putative endopeptidase n=1 Tax=Butyrivibrio proteoclasticus TaxID=43305 RepID=A0A1I5WBH4_9FIRM|nr:M13 family metallopeptidase [Butyrivibrio proteoclasticus]SFQ17104.1 putative endopeptidase [Butyrivibrio proteoclasticus]